MRAARFLAYAQTPRHGARVERATALCSAWLAKCTNPSVAFSGGKDSTVVLHLVRSIAPDCQAHYSHPEFELTETREILDSTPNLREYAYRNQHADWFVAWSDPAAVPEKIEWFTGRSSAEWARAHEIDGVAVGIRSEENAYRRIAVRRYGGLFYAQHKQLWECWPIHDWTIDDVWAYILSRKVAYNRAYDRMDEAGIPLVTQRIGPFANRRALDRGQLAVMRTVFPEQFNRFAAEYPDAWRFV